MPAAARAVTAAGLALAASFALLAIVPLRSFREFAFVMTAGVLSTRSSSGRCWCPR